MGNRPVGLMQTVGQASRWVGKWVDRTDRQTERRMFRRRSRRSRQGGGRDGEG
jgi:hypothetical protein